MSTERIWPNMKGGFMGDKEQEEPRVVEMPEARIEVAPSIFRAIANHVEHNQLFAREVRVKQPDGFARAFYFGGALVIEGRCGFCDRGVGQRVA